MDILSSKDYKLYSKVVDALEQVDNGCPLKDFLDHDEVEDALRLLIKIGEQNGKVD